MPRSNHNDVLDAPGAYYQANCDKLVLCSREPTTFTEANTTYFLAGVALASGDFTLADGATNGRKVTTAAKSGVSVTNTGKATHAALLDTVNSKVLRVTEEDTIQDSGTAQAGGASTITLAAGASAADSEYVDFYVRITGGTGVGQSQRITGYVGATKVATVASAWTTQPDATSTYEVFGQSLTSGNTVDIAADDETFADPS